MTMTGNDRFCLSVFSIVLFQRFFVICNKVQKENQQNLLYYSYL